MGRERALCPVQQRLNRTDKEKTKDSDKNLFITNPTWNWPKLRGYESGDESPGLWHNLLTDVTLSYKKNASCKICDF
jgi:hypothetical protein